MKNFKKAIAIVLTFLMLFSFATPAFAANEKAEEEKTANLSISVTADKEAYTIDEKIIFTIVVENLSDFDAKDVKVTNILDLNLKAIDSDTSIYFGTIPAGEKVTKTLEVADRSFGSIGIEGVAKAFSIVATVFNTIRMIIGQIIAPFLSYIDTCEVAMGEETVGILSIAKSNAGEEEKKPSEPEEPDVPDEPDIPDETEEVFYIVNFESNGGSEISGQSVLEGDKAFEPVTPVLEGYEFIAWYVDAEFTETYDFSAPVTANITLYAKWEEVNTALDVYTVTFESNGGSAIESQTVAEGNCAFMPSVPVLEGYRFIAWYMDGALTEVYDFSVPVIANVTLYAKWEEINNALAVYTVTFESNGGSAVEPQTVTEGNCAIIPSTPEFEGYRFLAWYSDSDLNTVFDFTTTVNSNITLYAKWELITTNSESFLDKEDPDVEIYNFTSDVWDVLINKETTVTFTAEIFSNIELDEDDVYVVNGDDINVGYMNDVGMNGDVTANDGIYTLKLDCLSESVKMVDFYAIAKNIRSDKFTLSYYREFTEEDFQKANLISGNLDIIVEEFLSDNNMLEIGQVEDVVKSIREELDRLVESDVVSTYTIDGTSILISTVEGYTFLYDLSVEGMDAGGNVSTYQPYFGQYSSSSTNELSNSATDGSAQKIEDEFGNYTFANNYDFDEVTLDELRTISDNEVILWHDHGGYNSTVGSYMLIGESVNADTNRRYNADISASRVLVSGNKYVVTGGFFDKYLSANSLDGALVYLATCSSGRDMIDNVQNRYSLVQSFINKGADAVFGNSGVINTVYNCKMMRSVISRMCEVKDEDTYTYYSASEALAYARNENGNVDGNGTRVILFPENDSTATNYSFEQDLGVVSGSVASAENNSEIANALVRVYDLDGNLIKSTRTNSSGYYSVEIPEGEYIIKISAGNYKSAKMSVVVNANRTTYNETFLLVNQTISVGYANGVIINAVTGAPVSGVIINIRKNWSNTTGEILYTTYTNENGYYEVPLVVGLYTMEYYKGGYNTGYKNIYTSVLDIVAQNAAISPVSSEGLYRIELSWGKIEGVHSRDLDSHLVGPSSDGSIFHLYFPMADANGGHDHRDEYTLDLDDTQWEGPENTSIHKMYDGTYYFFVHNWSGNNNGILKDSEAQVKVYRGSTLTHTFNVPTDQGNGIYWNVFAIVNGEVVVQNTITDDPDISYAGSVNDNSDNDVQ